MKVKFKMILIRLVAIVFLFESSVLFSSAEEGYVDPPEKPNVVESKTKRREVLEMLYDSEELQHLRCPKRGTKKDWIIAMGFPLNPIDEDVWVYIRKEPHRKRVQLDTWRNLKGMNPSHVFLVVFEDNIALNNVYTAALGDLSGTVASIYKGRSERYKTTQLLPKRYRK